MTHPVLSSSNAIPTQRNRRLLLTLPAAVALPSLITACGGGADLSYETEQALYFVDEAITPNKPQPAPPNPPPPGHTAPKFTVFPPLPAGLTLNAETGVISGTPTKLKRQGSHLIIASNNKGVVQTQVRITVTGRGSWSPVAAIPGARQNASISPLPGGNFLVAGGLTAEGSTDSVEIYDASTATWSSARPLKSRRYAHCAVVLRDGRVLVLGGDADDYYPGATELYNPVSMSWSETGHMKQARSFCSAHLLPGGKVLAVGGSDSSSNAIDTVEMYDPATQIWTLLPTRLSAARASHAAVLLADGKTLLVLGGDANNTAELYKVDGSATKVIPFVSEGSLHQAVRLDDGSVLVTSDLSELSRRFNPITAKWTTSATVSGSRDSPTLTVLADGRVLLVGGRNLSASEIYNPDVNRWTAAAPVTAQRYVATAALLGDGSVLFVSGRSRAGLVTTCERYLP